ncbi:MAG: SAF domain-containing protein [Pasteurellaceae bacterium]|nr:SAF domain-containing protein [Pasteurellaceae bacterium]
MNYRILFFIAALILSIGIGGLFFLPVDETQDASPTTQAQPEIQKVPEVVIMTAVVNKNLSKGKLLQADDYTLSELTVEETSPLIQSNLKPFMEQSQSSSLQGFLLAENLTAGSLLSSHHLIAPNDDRFLISSLDPKQEVAYRIYLEASEQYILDTVRQGDNVSVFSQQQDLAQHNTDKKNLIKLVDNLTVLRVQALNSEKEASSSAQKPSYIGYLTVKIDARKVQTFYALEHRSKLVVLPSYQSEATNHRGSLIRKLRGQ